MKAVILAAGIASRLRPLTDTTPKCLLKVGERCLLQRAFDALLQNGFREFVIVTGYRQQQIVNFLEAHYPALEVTFIYNEKYASTNNIYSLWLTRPYVDKEDIWDLVGGYSIEYSPGMYSDPDFTAKLYMCGVRFMKGLQASRIYHFETKSTTRIRKNCGQMQFLLKWGMTSSTFRKVFTYKGKDFKSQKIGTFKTGNRFKISLIRGRLKAIFYLLTKDFGPLWKFWKKTFV